MAHAVEERTIDCSPLTVWEVLADFGAIARWAPNVDHSCLTTAEQSGPGVARRVQVGRFGLLEHVVAWEPEHTLAYQIEGLPSVIRSVSTAWSLDAVGDRTRVKVTTDVDAGPRPPQQVIARIAAKRLSQASQQMLAGLHSHLSARSELSPRVHLSGQSHPLRGES